MPRHAPPRPSLRSIQERDALVLANLRLVPYMVRRMQRLPCVRRLGQEDAMQEGYLCLLRAAELWEEGRVAFPTYACRAILGGLLTAARSMSCHAPDCLPLPQEDMDYYEALAAPQPICDPLEAHEATECLRRMHPHRRFAVRRTVLDGLLLRQVAKRLRCSHERVRALREESLGWLRERLLGAHPSPLGGKMSCPNRFRRKGLPKASP